jgi:hypothetical protein
VAAGVNSAWLAGYAGFWLEVVSQHLENNVRFGVFNFEWVRK